MLSLLFGFFTSFCGGVYSQIPSNCRFHQDIYLLICYYPYMEDVPDLDLHTIQAFDCDSEQRGSYSKEAESFLARATLHNQIAHTKLIICHTDSGARSTLALLLPTVAAAFVMGVVITLIVPRFVAKLARRLRTLRDDQENIVDNEEGIEMQNVEL